MNQFGILACALVAVIVVSAGLSSLPRLQKHLNRTSTVKMGAGWRILVGGIVPVALGYMLINEIQTKSTEQYSGYPAWFNGVFGWGMAGALIVGALLLTLIPWSEKSRLKDPEYEEFNAAAELDGDVDNNREEVKS